MGGRRIRRPIGSLDRKHSLFGGKPEQSAAEARGAERGVGESHPPASCDKNSPRRPPTSLGRGGRERQRYGSTRAGWSRPPLRPAVLLLRTTVIAPWTTVRRRLELRRHPAGRTRERRPASRIPLHRAPRICFSGADASPPRTPFSHLLCNGSLPPRSHILFFAAPSSIHTSPASELRRRAGKGAPPSAGKGSR